MLNRVIDPGNDPFLWLEDVEGEDALTWVRERNARAEGQLQDDQYHPLREELLSILESPDRIPGVTTRGEHLYNFWTDAEHPQGLWRRTTLESYRREEPEWEILLDLDELSALEGTTWVWHGARVLRPAQGQPWRRALISLSRGGSDADVTREFDIVERRFIAESEGGFYKPEGKGGLSWIDENTVYASIDTPATTSGYPQTARRWARGTDLSQAQTVISVGEDDLMAGAGYDSTPGYERHTAVKALGFYDSETYVLTYPEDPASTDPMLQRVEVPTDVGVGFHRDLIFLAPRTDFTHAGVTYPGGSLIVGDAETFLAGKPELTVLFAPTESTSLQGITATRNLFVLTVMEDVVEHLEAHWRDDVGTWRSARVFTSITGSLSVSALDSRENDQLWITAHDFLTPTSKYLGDLAPVLAGHEETAELIKQAPERFEAEGLAYVQRFAPSEDGTPIPYFLIGPAETVQSAAKVQDDDGAAHEAAASSDAGPASDGSSAVPGVTSIAGPEPRPTILYGYGGFEVSQTPGYLSLVGKAWLERGGVFALANIRGGGEYGPRWHRAALRENRHKAFEDFAAVARDLVETGVTTVEQLACRGGSNGGLLTGNMLTRYPGRFGAVVIQVPLLDMKRYAQLLAGASWRAEYGDPETDDWQFLQHYSPYHQLSRDVAYPPVLLTTSTRDDRVHPGHARKMTAALEEIGAEVTYWENTEGGHGGAANSAQQATMNALIYRWLWQHLER
ncbi:prolyl oligopeptidase family serine peptidase [Nesterenkonia flava]|uniref:Prolyl oligopeptidase family serine peptidase n=1 Tax=Nesterenkonia flava TaxID=469799 RepID=A0ABU1FUB8_9MICC|nr:prolyl oligopeptidase family serine peptidase [Nesterenkonia flava]MDR5711847.1 prolyl oligopeptidase family serine peptidase [Nesterenkonia flava]